MKIRGQQVTEMRSRTAFTLIETFVALALLGLIIGSVSTSLNLYWKYRSTSQQRVASSQIFRGVLEDLTTDLRSASPMPTAVQKPPNIPVVGFGPPLNMTPMIEKTLKVQEQLLNLTNDEKRPIHFVGTSAWMSFLTVHQNSRFDDSTIKGSDQRRHIIWWWNNRSPISVPFAVSGPRQISGSVASPDSLTGVARAVRSFSSEATITSLVSQRVSSMSFRYFDGTAWTQQWNSFDSSGLPQAVEVTISIQSDGSTNVVQTFIIDLPQGG